MGDNTGSAGEAKFYTRPITPRQEEEYWLPTEYGENRLVLMPRDPYWIFAYWEVTPSPTLLRVYDVTDIVFNGQNAWSYFDIEITGGANNWYLNVPAADRSYLADLGFLDSEGRFVTILRSNTVHTPRDRPSDLLDEEWRSVNYEEVYKLSGGYSVGKGSEELREMFSRGRKVREEGFSPGIPGVSSWR